MNNQPRYNQYFWGLVLVAVLLTGFGAIIVSYGYVNQWTQTLWHVCREGLQDIEKHSSVSWQLAILALLLLGLLRGLWSLSSQVWRTYRFEHKFLPLQTKFPSRLKKLLDKHHLTSSHIIFLEVAAVHAFCLGFWQPRIWLTAGLLISLSDDELNAVLAHEAHHLRRRDPLRLAISRAIRNAFFFLPLMNSLARQAELNQEIEADNAAIAHLGDDLPLLCALQKLLARRPSQQISLSATVTAFNITEARLKRLIYPSAPQKHNWRRNWNHWLVNLGVFAIITSFGYLSVQPVMEHTSLDACTVEDVVEPLQSQLPLNEWSLSDKLHK